MIDITEDQINEGLGKAYRKAGNNAYFGNGFQAGVKFTIEQIEKITPHVDMPSLGYVKDQRKKLNLSLRQVAEATGVSAATILRIEQGHDAFYSNVLTLLIYYNNQNK